MALFAPTGERCGWLSAGLSLLHQAVGPVTARKYVHALRRLLDAGRADLALAAELGECEEAALRAIRKLLSRAGCGLEHHRLPGGAVLVSAPERLVPCVDTALTALGHCYTLLGDRGKLDFDPIHGAAAELAPLPGVPARRRLRQFVVANRHRSLPLAVDPHCADLARELARDFPPGIAAAISFTAYWGDRIGETIVLTCADWAASGFGDWIACPNKGSNGARTKRLYLDAAHRAELVDYFDGPRRELTGLGLADLQRIHRRNPRAPELLQPLFLNTLGRGMCYSLVNDHYWRPAMQKAGSAAVLHWLRHERAIEDLLAIREMGLPPGEEEEAIRILAQIMGWASGPDMLFYYAAPLADLAQRRLLALIAAAKDSPPAVRTAPPRNGPVPPAFAAFAAGRRS